jgi:hypothetical protein
MDPIWIRSYPQGVPAQIDANALGTIADYLDDAVHLHADRAAFVSGATGEQLLEARAINKSLTVLGRVMCALVERQRRPVVHVPYRDSRLTFLLQVCLCPAPRTCPLLGGRPCAADPAQLSHTACPRPRAHPPALWRPPPVSSSPASPPPSPPTTTAPPPKITATPITTTRYATQESLGGNSKTRIVACVSPSAECAGETLSTLLFAAGAKKIRNKVRA